MRAGLCAGLLMSALVACGENEPPAPSIVETYMADPAAVDRGEALFVGTCAGYCHSFERDNTDALYLFDCEWKHGDGDQDIFNTVIAGIPNTRMVGFGDNFPEGEADLWKIIAFLRTNQESCA
ncbi:MAG: c-type cytochrome [Pseudohongiellaceae bacterium]